MSHASIIGRSRVRPIWDIQGFRPALHALHDLSPSSAREGTLWAFLAFASPFPKDAHLYWELPADAARSSSIVRRLLAVPSRSRASFERLIVQIPGATARGIEESHVQAVRASGIRLALWASCDLSKNQGLDRLHPDYIRIQGSCLDDDRRVGEIEAVTKTAWDLGAAVVATGVRRESEIEAALRYEIRFAEGALLGRPVRVERLASGEELPWALPVQGTGAAGARGLLQGGSH